MHKKFMLNLSNITRTHMQHQINLYVPYTHKSSTLPVLTEEKWCTCVAICNTVFNIDKKHQKLTFTNSHGVTVMADSNSPYTNLERWSLIGARSGEARPNRLAIIIPPPTHHHPKPWHSGRRPSGRKLAPTGQRRGVRMETS
jgi:hypothetical protein